MVLRKNFSLWLGLAILVFYAVGYVLFGAYDSKKVMDALVVGSAVTISITWYRAAIAAIRSGVADGSANIVVSLWAVWILLMLYFVWVVVFTISGSPDSWRRLPIGGAFSAMFFVAGAYAILAPVNVRKVELERPVFMRWVVAVGAGMFVAGALVSALFLGALDYGAR